MLNIAFIKLSEDANKLNEYLNTGTPDIEQMVSLHV